MECVSLPESLKGDRLLTDMREGIILIERINTVLVDKGCTGGHLVAKIPELVRDPSPRIQTQLCYTMSRAVSWVGGAGGGVCHTLVTPREDGQEPNLPETFCASFPLQTFSQAP